MEEKEGVLFSVFSHTQVLPAAGEIITAVVAPYYCHLFLNMVAHKATAVYNLFLNHILTYFILSAAMQ